MAGKKLVSRVKAGTSKVSAEDRRMMFVEAYLSNGRNATDAALQAGYSKGGAAKQGYRMSKDPVILSMLEQRRTNIAVKTELSTDEIMADMARALRFDPRKLFGQDGTFIPIHALDDDVALCLTSIETVIVKGTEGSETPLFVKKIKWESKATARDQALKVFGMYEKDNQQKAGVMDGLPRELVRLMVERLKAISNGQR